MTEEIIVDGVNVAGCRHLKNDGIKKPICRSGGCIGVYNSCLCEDNRDCDYKQLKRLEQENKELKEWKERVVKLFESACRCKYLNEEKDICSYTNKKCININKCVYKYQELSNTYRSALEEIRELAEKSIKISYNLEVNSMLYDIIDKINECLGE